VELGQAALLGAIEGVTEFLPVSSTFHLIWAQHLLGIAGTDLVKLFEVVIQAGAVLAVLALYLRTILTDRALVVRLFVSFVPTAVVGLVLYRAIKDVLFADLQLQLAVFALVGVLFVVVERAWADRPLRRLAVELSYRDAALGGLAQAFAVVPGVSRAGAVIVALIALGVRRDDAARYSFLLALPTIVAAAGYDLYQSRDALAAGASAIVPIAIGFGVAFVTALAVVRWFVAYLQRHTLTAFGAYRIVAALALAAILLTRP